MDVLPRVAGGSDGTAGGHFHWATFSWILTVGAVVVSLIVVPGALTYYFATAGPPSSGSLLALLIGMIALVPGFLMGAAGLWVCAQG